MSKHDVLTREEFDQYSLRPAILRALEKKCRELGIKPAECRVLDWGCGRMRGILKLRQMGYQAYGADIDLSPVENGKALASSMGHDSSQLFRIIGADGHVDFADGMFHFIYSDQVFEHVSNMRLVAKEMARLTAPDGGGLHIYPARWTPWEGHLMMPFAHWMPKFGSLRKAWINLFVFLGVHCRWDAENPGQVYFDYLNNKTFYRSALEVQEAFAACNLKTHFDPLLDKRLERFLPRMVQENKLSRNLIIWLVTTFKSVHLCYQKI